MFRASFSNAVRVFMVYCRPLYVINGTKAKLFNPLGLKPTFCITFRNCVASSGLSDAVDPSPDPNINEVIELRGLPYEAQPEDILHFLSDVCVNKGIEGIHITMTPLGRPLGVAYVEVSTEEDLIKALKKNRQYLGRRFVLVSAKPRSALQNVISSSSSPEDGFYVRLRGLPYGISQGEIASFFRDYEISPGGITICADHLGRQSGHAFVRFVNESNARNAFVRHGDIMGSRFIEIFPSSKFEASHARKYKDIGGSAPYKGDNTQGGLTMADKFNENSVHLNGLPYSCQETDIKEFFKPLIPAEITLTKGYDGRPTGQAYVKFNTCGDASEAMKKDRQYIGSRYVNIRLLFNPESLSSTSEDQEDKSLPDDNADATATRERDSDSFQSKN